MLWTVSEPAELIYEGSVKRVWRAPTTDQAYGGHHLWFEFTDDYSVFDWGKMPDTIANKGRALVVMGALMFERLSNSQMWLDLRESKHLKQFNQTWLNNLFEHDVFTDEHGLFKKGMPSHMVSICSAEEEFEDLQSAARFSGRVFLEVLEAQVLRPTLRRLDSQSLYFYPYCRLSGVERSANMYLIPLEVVFRFGMPAGSSLKARLEKDPDYVQALGLSHVPKENQWFDRPVIEYFTKLEPKDRLLSMQEATMVSGLSGEQFERLHVLAQAVALGLFQIFQDRGIELWDGKVELLLDASSERATILLGDSVGPDELRLLYKGCHLSKEMIRQIYRGGAWETGIKEAQQQGRLSGEDWKEIMLSKMKLKPEPLNSKVKASVDKLYGVIVNHLAGTQLFADHPTIDKFVSELPTTIGVTAK